MSGENPPTTTTEGNELKKPRRFSAITEARDVGLLVRAGAGKSVKEIAKEYNLSENTVRRRLSIARQNDLIGIAREMMIDRLLAKALAVVSKELDNGNYKAAKDLLDGLGVYTQKANVTPQTGNKSVLDTIREEMVITDEGKINE